MNSQMILQLVISKNTTGKNEARLRELESQIGAAQCSANGGGGGCSPRSASWFRMFCPAYGLN